MAGRGQSRSPAGPRGTSFCLKRKQKEGIEEKSPRPGITGRRGKLFPADTACPSLHSPTSCRLAPLGPAPGSSAGQGSSLLPAQGNAPGALPDARERRLRNGTAASPGHGSATLPTLCVNGADGAERVRLIIQWASIFYYLNSPGRESGSPKEGLAACRSSSPLYFVRKDCSGGRRSEPLGTLPAGTPSVRLSVRSSAKSRTRAAGGGGPSARLPRVPCSCPPPAPQVPWPEASERLLFSSGLRLCVAAAAGPQPPSAAPCQAAATCCWAGLLPASR